MKEWNLILKLYLQNILKMSFIAIPSCKVYTLTHKLT